MVSASVTIERQPDGVVVAVLAGEIDLADSVMVEAQVAEATVGAAGVVIDLSQTTYLDSAGAALLYRLARELTEAATPLALVVAGGSEPARILNLGRLDTLVRTHETREAALGGLSAVG